MIMFKPSSRITRSIGIIVLVWIIVLSAVQLGKHYSLQTGGRDLGLFDHPLSSTLHGHFLKSSLLPETARNYFGFHFCPVILFFLPFYALIDSPAVLLIGHVIVLGLSALALFAIARRLTNERWAFLLTLTYLLYRPLTRVASCSYHQESFYPLFLFMAVYAFIIKKSQLQAWIWMALCLFVKEDVSIYLLPLAALMFLSREYRRTGAVLGVVCVVYFFAFNQFVLPLVSEGGSTEWPEHFRGYGSSHLEIMMYAAAHPLQLLHDVFDRQTIRTSADMLFLIGGLPLLSPISLVALMPAVGCFLSTLPVQRTLGLYYSATVFPYLFLGAIWGLNFLASRVPASRHHLITVYLGIMVLANTANSSFVQWVNPSRWSFTGRAAEARPVLDAIPRDASVEMQNCLITHVRPADRNIGIFPEMPAAEYIALFDGADPWPLSDEEFQRHLNNLRNNKNLRIVATNGACILYQRIKKDSLE